MNRTIFIRALLAGSALTLGTSALAQTPPTPGDQPTAAAAASTAPDAMPDQSDAAADAAIQGAGTGDDAQAKIELLQAQVDALQTALEAVKASVVKTTPSWKGGPLFEDKDSGFSFKPKGTLQFDAGYVGFPRGNELRGTMGGINYGNLGFNTRARRAIIGAEGTLPGGFSYNVEFNLAQAAVDYEDILIAYQRKGSPLRVTIGNFYPMSSLETVTSSKFTSFMERPSFTDAFNLNRRLGVSVALLDPKTDRFSLTAGLFSQPINDYVGGNSTSPNFQRTGWEAGIRGTFSPKLGDTQLHLGASLHHRVNQREAQGAQYRARPLLQTTDQRFVDTGSLAAKGDDSVGLELAAIHKSFHFAAEAQKLWVHHAYTALEAAALNGTPGTNDTVSGTVFLNDNPSFEGGYAEVGYYLTGETRGYKGGKFDRTKVLHPFDQGGWGALQFNARVDYINLNDRLGPGTNLTVTNPNFVNGGKQIAYMAGLVWSPIDYLRFTAQYAHLNVTGGPRAISPLFASTSSTPINERKYSVDTAGLRAQVDF